MKLFEKKKIDDTYKAYISCVNCGKRVNIRIPKGTNEIDYLCGTTFPDCGRCGCNSWV